MFKFVEIVFVFFAKIYIFFYRDKGDYWKIFPCIIMSSILMINIQMFISFFFSISKILIVGLLTCILLFFKALYDRKDYSWIVEYPLLKKQKIIVVSVLIIDFVIVAILTELSRNIYMTTHGIVR